MKRRLVAIAMVLLLAVVTGADAPPSKYIDTGTYPFECCTYRAWHMNADTVAYAQPDKNVKVVGRLKLGAIVEAITGEVQSSPVRFVVKKPHAEYQPGDILWVYTYLGEGHFKGWRNGTTQKEDLGFSPYGGFPGASCDNKRQAWGELVHQAKLGASGRVQVPAESGLTTTSSRV